MSLPVENFKCTVKKFGYPGAKAAQLVSSKILQNVLDWEPDAIFIQIGGNDFCENVEIKKLADNIKLIYDKLAPSIKSIHIGEILVRGDTRFLKAERYTKIRSYLNKALRQHYFPGTQVIVATKIKHHHLADDNCHLNDEGKSILVDNIKPLFDV